VPQEHCLEGSRLRKEQAVAVLYCGVMGRLPAVEINGCVVSKGKSVTGEEVLSMVRRFAP